MLIASAVTKNKGEIMRTKLKAPGFGLLTALAVSAFGIVNVSANTGGHFTTDAPNTATTVLGTEGDNHQLDFEISGIEGKIGCDEASYHGLIEGTTAENITMTPAWNRCYTTPGGTEFNIHSNGCHFKFTIRPEPEVKHNTVHLDCPEENVIEITHPNCNIQIPPHTVKGVVYETIILGEKHALTLESTIEEITTHFESFGCILVFGTKHTGKLIGSATVEGFDVFNENRVNITAT